MSKQTYGIRLEESTNKTLNHIGTTTMREVLDTLAQDYVMYMGNTELLFKTLALKRIDNEIKEYYEIIELLKEEKSKLLEDVEEMQQVRHDELNALNEVWDKLCIIIQVEENNNKTYDYTDVYSVFQQSLMSDSEIILFCKDKLDKLIKPLVAIPKDNRSKTQKVMLGQWQYMLNQIEIIEERQEV